MCFFEQTRWACGSWRWGNFRDQCQKEYRTGETCGLMLVYETHYETTVCQTCRQIEKKERRVREMARNIERWLREGNRTATIEKTRDDMADVLLAIARLREKHEVKGLGSRRKMRLGF